MQSGFVTADAEALAARYGDRGVPRDLALRVYTTRLLGREPRLVLHGGGNTSVKTRLLRSHGPRSRCACVKGSGSDMAAIEPAGPARRAACRVAPAARARRAVTDDEMVRLQRANLLDPEAPNPSVETLLHAFMPAEIRRSYPRHRGAELVDQPDGEARAAELYDGRMAVVPYIMPGFAPCQAGGGYSRGDAGSDRPDPAQARHFHLRRQRRGSL